MSLCEEKAEEDVVQYQNQTAAFPESNRVSMKSDASLTQALTFSAETATCNPRNDQSAELQDSHRLVNDGLQRVKDQHKVSMKNKYESLFEVIKLQKNQTLLNSIYTLYIIDGESGGVNEEHEVLHMEKTTRTNLLNTRTHLQNTIYCNDIFKSSTEPACGTKDKIKTVLTKGIAGIGKTVSVKKFILDWVEGKSNQDVDFMFVLPFRELNLIRDHQYSLHRLLLDFNPELQDLGSKIYEECKILFIFDGLDESRMNLVFSDNEKVSDVTEASLVGVLMSNLMKGELLPSALIWITSRPAAAHHIPSKYIHRVTEIQGFDEPQKEEYFRKRINDENQASRIISHIRRARSLHIMCQIPVFSWISSIVLQKLLKEDVSAEIPQTLTEMYIHFLLIQINMRNQKYKETDPEKLLQSNREMILKLAELAFNQLMKGNVIFYEEDLKESGIDGTDTSVYFGICTELFKEESVIHRRKVYSFIHLSFQEFLAAFYVLYSHLMKNREPLQCFLGDNHELCRSKRRRHWKERPNRRMTKYKGLLTDREQKGTCSESPTGGDTECCESLASALQSSNSHLMELDLSNNDLRDLGVKLLSNGLKNSHCQLNILRLSGCMVTEEGCCYLSSALNSNPSHLRELDLSYNHPGESGVRLLSDLLNHPNCTLEKLNVDHGGEFRITAGLHKYFCDLTMDPDTANTKLILSEENRKVTYVDEDQPYPDHPERFNKRPHVLCRERLSGRCYWEAEWSGQADISVTYKGICRKGKGAE
ncbi:hypothetical protein cypCar_00034320, partial [Cyprinus carpio]